MMKDKEQINIGIIHKYALYRESMKQCLRSCTSKLVVFEGGTLRDGLTVLKKNKPNIILLDYSLMKSGKRENVGDFKTKLGKTQLILLLEQDMNKDDVMCAIEHGARGLLTQDMGCEILTQAIQTVRKGQYWLHPKLSHFVIEVYQDLKKKYLANIAKSKEKIEKPYPLLTNRECQVLDLMVKGYCNKNIMEELGLKEPTVKAHINSILEKLHVPDRLNAVLVAIRNGWVKVDKEESCLHI